MNQITPKDNLAALIFDVETQLNEMRILKKKSEFYLAFQVLKELNAEYFEEYKEFFVAPDKIKEYNNILRTL